MEAVDPLTLDLNRQSAIAGSQTITLHSTRWRRRVSKCGLRPTLRLLAATLGLRVVPGDRNE